MKLVQPVGWVYIYLSGTDPRFVLLIPAICFASLGISSSRIII